MTVSGEIKIIRETRLDPGFPLSRHELIDVMRVILDAIGLAGSSLAVKLVDDREIARLNAEFMGCFGPTNVLSFPADQGEDTVDTDEDNFLGELALSVDALARETSLYGQSPVGHLARLLAHGTLHLAGYDHGDTMYDLTDAAVDRVLLEYPDHKEM